MRFYPFLILFVVAATVAAISFTPAGPADPSADPDLVWFVVDPYTGDPIDPFTGGRQGFEPQTACAGGDSFCATALSIMDGDVIDNGNGTFRIFPGVDITDPYYWDDRRFKRLY